MKRMLALLLVSVVLLVSCGEDKPAATPEGSFAAVIGENIASSYFLGNLMMPEGATLEQQLPIDNGIRFTMRGVEAAALADYAEEVFLHFKSRGFVMYKTVYSERSGRPLYYVKTENLGEVSFGDPYGCIYEVLYEKDGAFFAVDIYYYKNAEGLFLKDDTVIEISNCTEILEDLVSEE